MTDAIVPQLTARFNELSQTLPGEGIEFWFARDLMEPMSCARWENFTTAIHQAIDSCNSTGNDEADHFRGVTTMVPLGSDAERPAASVRDKLISSRVTSPNRPEYRGFRAGDVRHILADTSKAQRLLGYETMHSIAEGSKVTAPGHFRQQN